jgi:hypothetical protein
MQADINAFLDRPVLLFATLLIGGCIGIVVERFVETRKKAERRAYWAGRKAVDKGRSQGHANSKVASLAVPDKTSTDAADQLRTVMAASFKARPLLNKPERRLLAHLDRILAEDTPGWRAMGQVSLGEILWSDDKEAFWAVNAKRVDLLIVDADCQPLHAIEFQGTGHHQSGNAAAARDAVKKEALRRADIGYVEIVSGDTPTELRGMIRKLVARMAENTPTAKS